MAALLPFPTPFQHTFLVNFYAQSPAQARRSIAHPDSKTPKMPATASQYQHFVPQFLLRNFAHPYKPKKEGPRNRKNGKTKYEKGMFPGDKVVRTLNLTEDSPVICEKPISRVLGQMNMYSDSSKVDHQQQHQVEKLLSKLESQACQIFRRITKAFEDNEAGLWITRSERDLIRKFLFILKYRGSGFHHRFYHDKPKDYAEIDRELLREYMAERGFTCPFNVWLDNLRAIIELEMDPEGEWKSKLLKRMYMDDAMWFITHAQCSYMAICTPSDIADEFVLTDNSYNIFEGPNTFVQDTDTGEVGESGHVPIHEFAPVSPKLMIVLRSFLLPNPREDADEKVKASRNFWRFCAVDGIYDYWKKSLLDDLPITKARNNYTRVFEGRLQYLDVDETKWKRLKSHKFYFSFFPVSTKHVHTINAILLDNCWPCTHVVFESAESFTRTLEWYLTAPCTVGKIIMGYDIERREAALKKLETISRSLGSTKETVWKRESSPPMRDYDKFRLRHAELRRAFKRIITGGDSAVEEVRKERFEASDSPAIQTYRILGGTFDAFSSDMDQVPRMSKLRVMIDIWSRGVDETIRQRNRALLLDAYLQLPPHRVWLYVKVEIWQVQDAQGRFQLSTNKLSGNEPEDIIARGKCPLLHTQLLMTNVPLPSWHGDGG
ncbi:hypothetical protein B0T26DRAFT_196561 [Lasiosphaeria miniovina]|uniref:Uncharacterized protein n=1 Tax=Lasiosphaeria miniovina TaxID=1954250 RepID=A0AA40DZ69_9PEZI|nr:uncharacterized protein B0T26DRAFT_196561 [Lasiosphaeria miniovina]KAK0721954.1 hypothetical protein B0T26DRAFT_196561 [Lasiosphaeria miniovina]